MPAGNTVNRITYRQYKIFDVLLLLVIMVVFEIINVFAIERWFPRQTFSLSVMLLMSLVAIFRWGWLGVLLPIVDGVLVCLLESYSWEYYIMYGVGNAFIILTCLLFLWVKKETWTSRWLLTLAFALIGYVLLVLGRSIVSLFFGGGFWDGIIANLENEFFNAFFAIAGLLILRRFNPMLVDQKEYCKKRIEERENPRHPDEYHWEGYAELDQEELDKLKAMNDYDKAVYYNDHVKLKGDGESDEADEDDLSKLDG